MRRGQRLLTGVLFATVAGLTGCADGGEQGATAPPASRTSSGSATATSPGYSSTATVEIQVSIRDGKVTPKPRRVEVPAGVPVQLVVTSDVDDEIHIHGLDSTEKVRAGRPTTIEITLDQPGVYEIETHETELTLVQLEVR